jgi:hypothetical protein
MMFIDASVHVQVTPHALKTQAATTARPRDGDDPTIPRRADVEFGSRESEVPWGRCGRRRVTLPRRGQCASGYAARCERWREGERDGKADECLRGEEWVGGLGWFGDLGAGGICDGKLVREDVQRSVRLCLGGAFG